MQIKKKSVNMVRRADHEKVRSMLKDTITLLCKNGLSFKHKFTIEAVIGVTLDDEDVMLVSISELIKSSNPNNYSSNESSAEDNDLGDGLHKRKGHKRKRRKHNRPSKDSELEYSDGPTARLNHTNSAVVNTYIVDSMNHQTEMTNENPQSDAESDKGDDLVFVKQEMENNWSQSQSAPTFPDFSDLAASQHTDLSFPSMSLHSSFPPIPSAKMVRPQENIWQAMSPQSQFSPATSGAMVATPSRSHTSPAVKERNIKPSPQSTQQYSTPKSSRFQCSFCRKSFSEKWYLRTHENTHRGIYPYQCPVCNKGLLTTQHLRMHVARHDKEQGNYLCMKCNSQFQSSEALEGHIMLCANEADFFPQILSVATEINNDRIDDSVDRSMDGNTCGEDNAGLSNNGDTALADDDRIAADDDCIAAAVDGIGEDEDQAEGGMAEGGTAEDVTAEDGTAEGVTPEDGTAEDDDGIAADEDCIAAEDEEAEDVGDELMEAADEGTPVNEALQHVNGVFESADGNVA